MKLESFILCFVCVWSFSPDFPAYFIIYAFTLSLGQRENSTHNEIQSGAGADGRHQTFIEQRRKLPLVLLVFSSSFFDWFCFCWLAVQSLLLIRSSLSVDNVVFELSDLSSLELFTFLSHSSVVDCDFSGKVSENTWNKFSSFSFFRF